MLNPLIPTSIIVYLGLRCDTFLQIFNIMKVEKVVHFSLDVVYVRFAVNGCGSILADLVITVKQVQLVCKIVNPTNIGLRIALLE
jgi:hypothetical protein